METTVIGQTILGLDAIVFFDDARDCELVRPIPTLSGWGLLSLAVVLGILGIVGFLVIRRRKVSA